MKLSTEEKNGKSFKVLRDPLQFNLLKLEVFCIRKFSNPDGFSTDGTRF